MRLYSFWTADERIVSFRVVTAFIFSRIKLYTDDHGTNEV